MPVQTRSMIRKQAEAQKAKEVQVKVKEAQVEDICPICLDCLSCSEITTTKCGHKFHTNCLVSSISKCPMCREKLHTESARQNITYAEIIARTEEIARQARQRIADTEEIVNLTRQNIAHTEEIMRQTRQIEANIAEFERIRQEIERQRQERERQRQERERQRQAEEEAANRQIEEEVRERNERERTRRNTYLGRIFNRVNKIFADI